MAGGQEKGAGPLGHGFQDGFAYLRVPGPWEGTETQMSFFRQILLREGERVSSLKSWKRCGWRPGGSMQKARTPSPLHGKSDTITAAGDWASTRQVLL